MHQTKPVQRHGTRTRATATAALLVALLALCPVYSSAHPQAHQPAIDAALAVLDEFMLAFNRRDMSAWASTLNYPHVRFASGEVRVWPDQNNFETSPPFTRLVEAGWDHSQWIKRDIVMASPDKVHIATTFERYNEANVAIGRFESLYIVTRVNGRWGIQSRSSLAP